MSIYCDKICLRNEKDQKISSRRIELPELLFLSGEFELTASDMDTGAWAKTAGHFFNCVG